MSDELTKRVESLESGQKRLESMIESHFQSLHARLFLSEQRAKLPQYATTGGGIGAAVAALLFALQQLGVL